MQVRISTRNYFTSNRIVTIRQEARSSVDKDVGRPELWSVDCVSIPQNLVKFRACALWIAIQLLLNSSEDL